MAASGSALLLCAAAALIGTQGGLFRFAPPDRYLAALDSGVQGRYVEHRFRALETSFPADNKKKVLVVGDSFAQDFINMIFENNALTAYDIRYAPRLSELSDQGIPQPRSQLPRI